MLLYDYIHIYNELQANDSNEPWICEEKYVHANL